MIDTVRFLFKIAPEKVAKIENFIDSPPEKVAKIENFIHSLLLESDVTFREIGRLAGLIISMTVAVGPIARLFTKQMYSLFEQERLGQLFRNVLRSN